MCCSGIDPGSTDGKYSGAYLLGLLARCLIRPNSSALPANP